MIRKRLTCCYVAQMGLLLNPFTDHLQRLFTIFLCFTDGIERFLNNFLFPLGDGVVWRHYEARRGQQPTADNFRKSHLGNAFTLS